MHAAADEKHPEGIGPRMRRRLAGFLGMLRDNGFTIGLAETADALAILASPAAARPSLLKSALRALICSTHSDWRRFDELFDAYWGGRGMRRMQPLSASATPRRTLQRSPDVDVRRASSDLPD